MNLVKLRLDSSRSLGIGDITPGSSFATARSIANGRGIGALAIAIAMGTGAGDDGAAAATARAGPAAVDAETGAVRAAAQE